MDRSEADDSKLKQGVAVEYRVLERRAALQCLAEE